MNNWEYFCEEITTIIMSKPYQSGKVADYIPQLAKVNPDLFGISVISVNNQVFNIGDTTHVFVFKAVRKQ